MTRRLMNDCARHLRPVAIAALAASAGLALASPPANQTRDDWRNDNREHATSRRMGPHAPNPGPVGYRTYNGTGNNLANPAWGTAGSLYLRERAHTYYADGLSSPAGTSRPSARAISNALAAQGDVETEDERGLSTAVYEWGQFLDHDIGLAMGGHAEAFDIAVPTGDTSFDPLSTGTKVIFFDRSAFDASTGATSPRQQINTVTSFIDGSQVYGSDDVRAAWLRSGVGGRLKTRSTPQGELLPFNDGTLANDDPLHNPVTSLVVAGDVRANEQPGLTVLHTVFAREHNWQAARLAAANPTWNDEKLYQEARKIVIAELQVITYKEFLPAILGRELPPYTGYRSSLNPGLSNAFATAAYRIGHSMVGPDIGVIDEHFVEIDSLDLAAIFFNPGVIPSIGGVDPVVRYFAINPMQKVDTQIVDPLRNFLFGPPGAGGFDLAALNIQRGRDHGLGDYNSIRADFGLPKVRSFSQITSDSALAAKLQSVFGSVNSIDPWVGMLAEDHLPGASVGLTHAIIFIDQFSRLRDGDRFWYQNGLFTRADLARLEATRLSDILLRTTGVARLQPNVFFHADLAAASCPADFDGSGAVDELDLRRFLRAFRAGDIAADFDHSGTVDADDLSGFLGEFFAGC